jgi:glycosidase
VARKLYLLLVLTSISASAFCQAPIINKIDPPDWWINMPAPMLLLHGEHLRDTSFQIGGDVHVARTTISENGHWAELWLANEPQEPIQVEITALNGAGKTSVPFRFRARRPSTDGFAGFSSRDVMYLIMTDRFADGDLWNDGPAANSSAVSQAAIRERGGARGWHGGDYKGILDHLDYLQQLGITTIWITPPYQNHERDSYHGYGATDMYAVDEHFGSMHDLRALAEGLHRHGMKLVLDTVPNHVGPAHPWAQDEPQPDWFHGTVENHRAATGVFQQLMNPSAPERDQRDVLDGWFVNLLPDMNQEDKAVSTYLIQNAIWWIESTGADGLRLDTLPYVPRQFWHDFHAELASLYPHLTDVGEVFNGTFALPPAVNAFFAGGVTQMGQTTAIDTGLYTPFDYPFYAVIRDVLLRDAPASNLALLFSQDALYPHPERLATLIGSHYTKRFLGDEHATPAKLQLALGLLLTVRGMPVIYSGDEIGMTGGDDPDNRRGFPGGFPGSQQSAFSAAGRTAEQAGIHDFVEKLLGVRKANPAFIGTEQQILYSSQDAVVFVRWNSGETVLVAMNRADHDASIHFIGDQTQLQQASSAKTLFGTGNCTFRNGTVLLHLPAMSIYVAKVD